MGSEKQRSSIDVVARVVGRVQETWAEGKLEDMLLMDIKDTFTHVSQKSLLRTIADIRADSDHM